MTSKRNRNESILKLGAGLLALTSLNACSSVESGSETINSIADYCPYIASPKTISGPTVTISGTAFYEYRIDGNLYVADGSHLVRLTSTNSATVTVNGTSQSATLTSGSYTTTNGSCSTASSLADALACSINNASLTPAVTATVVTIQGAQLLRVAPQVYGTPITVVAGTHATTTDSSNLDGLSVTMSAEPNRIRFAEVAVYDNSNTIIQCAETDVNGAFSFTVPQSSSSYVVQVNSRSNNAHNTAYVMDTPNNNVAYRIQTGVTAGANASSLILVAKATGTLEGGAFNILDQIYNAQTYLRTTTAGCDQSVNPNYFADCKPVTTVPMVHVYWKAGLTPGVYVGTDSTLSYYLNGKAQLYIGGGKDGNVNESDSDHFDNSVIVHEYGHFIEDHFATPNSPGGSHDGNSVIDPRLAWGEGWADFFQAAVLAGPNGATPRYLDTEGNTDCSGTSCYGIYFNEPLNSQQDDIPSADGEGIFHEFSITRVLYGAISALNGTPITQFTEIWRVLTGSQSGMLAVPDIFKSMGRFHTIQQTDASPSSWSTLRTNEMQTHGLIDFGNELNLSSSCTPATTTMNVYKSYYDDGSFAASDLLNSNDFYEYAHPGGAFNFQIAWNGGGIADLDIYIYKADYSYGDTSTLIASSSRESLGTSGTKTVFTSLPAGRYMINIMAYTYNMSLGTTTTNYGMTLNGVRACPKYY